MRYFYVVEDKDIFEEIRVIQDYGKSYLIERYDPISEMWVTARVNAIYVIAREENLLM